MSPQRLREKDAKVEGRDPPEMVKKTIEPFRSLLGNLLKVKPEEVSEQQRLYEESRRSHFGADDVSTMKRKKRRIINVASSSESDKGRQGTPRRAE
jgi:hypothetical protein